MSIENNLASIAENLRKLVDLLDKQTAVLAAAVPQMQPAPVPQAQPQAQPQVQPQEQPAPEPQAPTAQVFPMPQAQPAPSYPACPLINEDDVKSYCSHQYKTFGPKRGEQMKAVLTELGHVNLGTLRREQYAEFYAKIEALA